MTGQMINMLDYKGMISEGTEVGIADLPQEYIGELAPCLDEFCMREAFPSLRMDGAYAYYEESVIRSFFRSVTGVELDGLKGGSRK